MKNWFAVLNSRSQRRFKILLTVFPGNIFWISKHFVTKHGMVMHYHEPEHLAKRLVCCLHDQGYSTGLCNKKKTVSTVSTEPLILLQSNLDWWYIFIGWSVLWKDLITVFKVKVYQNVSEHLSRWSLLNRVLPKLVWWCTVVSWRAIRKDWFAVFKIKVTVKAYNQNVTFHCIFWTGDTVATKLGLIVYCHKLDCLVKRVGCCVHGQGHRKGSKFE